MNIIRVLDASNYAELARIENVINPLITEEINGVFNFEFETIYDEISKFASGGNIIAIEDDYFRIATTTKNLDGTYRVFAEHVSFALTRAFFEDYVGEGIDGTASEILTPVLDQIGWGIGSIIETPVKYYKPSQGTSVRKQILDIANLFGLEIIWDKFSVSLVELRGSLGPLEFKLGENLLGVSETLDLTGDDPQYSYEVDVLDLSQLEGYEGFTKIQLGDVVQLLAENIDLNGISRVVYRQYNPFEKMNVNLQIGFVAREFTNYERDEEEDEEETDETVSYFLSTFKVGQVDCLKLSGVEMDFESVLPDDVSTGVEYFVQGEHKSVSIALKSQYSDYHATVTKFYEDGSYIDYNLNDLSETLKTWNLPEKNIIALTVTVSEVPYNEVDLDIHTAVVYGVTFNKLYIDPIREFKIGKHNLLKMDALIDTEGENLNIDEDITAVIDYNLLQENKGMKLSLKNEFKKYSTYITLLDKNGLPTSYEYETVKDKISTWNFPRNDAIYVLVTVQEKPTGEFDPVIHQKVMYGVKFEYIQIEPLQVFKIGDEDCLFLEGVMSDVEPALDEYSAEIFYNKNEQHKGLRLSLKREFSSYHVLIKTISKKGATTEYDLNTVKNQIVNWSFPTENIMYVLIAVSQVSPDEFDSNLHSVVYYAVKFVEDEIISEPWLSEFRIGDEDCLMLPGIELDDANIEAITAELEYTKADQFTGLFLKLEEKYREAKILVTDETSKTINYSDKIVLPNGIKKILVTVTYGDIKQYYGLQFVQADFVGLITIKSKDEDGNVIATKEQSYTETGIHEVIADDIYGYELVSESPLKVELSVKEPEKVVEFIYKNVGGGNTASTGYTLEFGTGLISTSISFTFTKAYDSIESVTFGVKGTPSYVNFAWEPVLNTAGKAIGIKVAANPVVSGKSLSVQAVCYKK